jgi:ribonuclease HII
LKQKKQNNPNIVLESALLKKGYKYIIGIDEVGRGAWAGPVAVGAYMFSTTSKIVQGVKDSKLLNNYQRETLYKSIFKPSTSFIEFGNIEQINQIGISSTITELIKKIITKTYSDDVYYLIDGIFKESFVKNSSKIIHGDLMHYSISCASILAKVQRDRVMSDLHLNYPNYSFNLNKGYGTRKHQEGLKNYGITKIHRINYKPIALIYKSNGQKDSK